jgi:hypothetical protein
MSKLTLPDIKSDEAYIVGGCKHPYEVVECILNTGEIVMGTPCSMKSSVDWLVKEEGGRYIGVGVVHQ